MSKADRAVAQVLTKYPTLLPDEVAKLVSAWGTVPAALTSETVAPVFTIAHELAGYGETFGFPLVTVLARSLCRLLNAGDLAREQMKTVIDAHIATLHVIVRDNIRGHGGEIGINLAAGLDKAIAKFSLAADGDREGRLRDEVAALQNKK
ncbi:MAG TPA: hypothetical protein VGL83_18175 [Stellaceae bacterium]